MAAIGRVCSAPERFGLDLAGSGPLFMPTRVADEGARVTGDAAILGHGDYAGLVDAAIAADEVEPNTSALADKTVCVPRSSMLREVDQSHSVAREDGEEVVSSLCTLRLDPMGLGRLASVARRMVSGPTSSERCRTSARGLRSRRASTVMTFAPIVAWLLPLPRHSEANP